MKWIEETVKPEIENGSCKPRHVKVEKKKYNSDETYVVKKVAFFFPEHFKSVELEDWDDYNEKDYPYTENDEVKGIVWLRPGWYESIDCDNCDGYWSSPLKVIEWLDETTPEATTPLQEGKAATPVRSAEVAIKCFLSKWQCWFMLESNGKELMEAFKKELYQIVDYTATPAREVTPAAPVSEINGHALLLKLMKRKDEVDFNGQPVAKYIEDGQGGTTWIRHDAMVKTLNDLIAGEQAVATEEEIEKMAKAYAKQFNIPDMPIHSENERWNAIKHWIAGYKAHKGKQ